MDISKEVAQAMLAIEAGNLKQAAEIAETIVKKMRAKGVDPKTHPDIQSLAALMAAGLLASQLEKEDPDKLDQILDELQAHS